MSIFIVTRPRRVTHATAIKSNKGTITHATAIKSNKGTTKTGRTPASATRTDDWRERMRQRDSAPAPDFTGVAPIPLSAVDGTPPPPLLLGRLDPIEHTILYGEGGVGKGSLACSWIVRLTAAGHRVLILDYEAHGGEWRRRIEGLGGPESLDVQWIAPLADGLGPLWERTAMLRTMIVEHEVTYVVIDSAAMACGGDPLKAEVPIQYFEALQMLGVPTLTLAHITKAGDLKYPFGSVFWHNLARVTWSLAWKGEDDRILVNHKANNYGKPGAAAITMDWHNGKLRRLDEIPASVALTDRIIEVLTGAVPMTPTDIRAMLNEGIEQSARTTLSAVKSCLTRALGKPECQWTVDKDGRYRMKTGGL